MAWCTVISNCLLMLMKFEWEAVNVFPLSLERSSDFQKLKFASSNTLFNINRFSDNFGSMPRYLYHSVIKESMYAFYRAV